MPVMTIPVNIVIQFAAGGTLIVASGLILYAMIGRVNRKLPDDEQISYLFFYPAKGIKITREYRRLYPRSHLNTVRIILNALGFILMAICAAQVNRLGR